MNKWMNEWHQQNEIIADKKAEITSKDWIDKSSDEMMKEWINAYVKKQMKGDTYKTK